MNLLNQLFGRKQTRSREVAKNRLQLVLVHDRINLSPGKMEQLKDDLIDVISNYVEIDTEGIDITLTGDHNESRLTAHFPVIGLARQK